MTWSSLEENILEMFADAASSRGHVRRANNQGAAPARAFEFGELQAARFGLRTSKKAKSAEAREMARYYMRSWKRAVKADPVKAERYRKMACAYARKGWVKKKADPMRMAKHNAWKNADYARNRVAIRAKRKLRITPETRREWKANAKRKAAHDAERAAHEKTLTHARQSRYYAKLKADPIRYAKFLKRSLKVNLRRRDRATTHLKKRRCARCGELGHNRRRCLRLAADAAVAA